MRSDHHPKTGHERCIKSGPAPPALEAGAGRQGLLLTGQPGLAARTPHPRHDPGQGRSGGPPSGQRLTRRTPTGLRRDHLQGPQRRRALLQPPQAAPRLRHPLRQARRALPGNHPHRQHQPLAQTTYITGPKWVDFPAAAQVLQVRRTRTHQQPQGQDR